MSDYMFSKLALDGAFVIENFSVGDNRGGFTKCFEKKVYTNAGIEFQLSETFVSVSSKNVIRGLHFQTYNPQAKLVCVARGKVWDVIVDLRPNSVTYKKWIGIELSSENHKAVYVPRGFAHGFVSLEDETVMLYQCDGEYSKDTDTGIMFNDPDIGIVWPIEEKLAIHSKRDMHLMSLQQYENRPMIVSENTNV